MKYSLSLATLALLLTSCAQARFQPSQHDSFNIVLREKVKISSLKEKIVEIDLADNSASVIEELHKHGKKVICYFSGGTVEDYRDYVKDYNKVDGLVRNRYGAWAQERFIDYRRSEYKPLIKQRISEAIRKKCDAIDVDNVDLYQVSDVKKWSDKIERDDAIKFTSWLGQTAHDMGISIGLKNCLDIIDSVGKYYDFAINERCHERGECYWYKNYLKTGKPVFGIAYGSLESNRSRLCKSLNGLPITMVVKTTGRLHQQQVNFDIKEHCGSNYSSGKVDPPKPKDEPKKTTTTVKKTTTTTVKKTTTTTVKKTTTTTVKKTTTTTIKINPVVTPSAPAKQTPTYPTKQTPSKAPVNQAPVNQAPVNKAPVNPVPAKQEPAKQEPAKQEPAKQDKEEPVKQAEKQAPVVDNIDGNDNEENQGSGAAAGIAVSGSILGAAAVFVFLKKNPKKYENIKRGISRQATTIKRGASTLSRRVTTRGRN